MIAKLTGNSARLALSHGRYMRINSPFIRTFFTSQRQTFQFNLPRYQAVPHDTTITAFNAPPPLEPNSITNSQSFKTLRDPDSDVQIQLHSSSIALFAPSYGINEPIHFDHIWLRDVCEHPSSVEPASKQKLFHTSDISLKDGLVDQDSIRLVETNVGNKHKLELEIAFTPQFAVTNAFSATFSSAPEPSKEPHISRIPLSKLLAHATPSRYARSHADIGGTPNTWISSDLSSFPHSPKPPSKSSDVQPGQVLVKEDAFARPARMNWSSLLPVANETLSSTSLSPSETARFALVNGLMRDGLAFVTGVPTDKTGDSIHASDENSPNLARLAESLGEIRHTFYGSLWNVRSLGSSSRNIAYTNLDLGLHMDLCYFQNPPRFQFLHMLRNRVKGGQSIFVDSFAVAEEMWKSNREAWKVLTEVPVCFEYQNDSRHYRYTHPTFEIARESSGHAGPNGSDGMPRLTAINYSPPFQGNLPLRWPSEGVMVNASPAKRKAFYQSLQIFANLTHDAQFRYERMLQEGECVVFDNRRVLHSRRGFEWDEKAEGGDDVKRWLKGCYVDGDAIWSTYRTLLAKSRGGSLL